MGMSTVTFLLIELGSTAGDRVALLLVHGDALAGHDGLVDGGLPLQDRPVGGDRLAGEHGQDVARPHLVGGQDDVGAVPPDARRPGLQPDQLLDAAPRLLGRVVLQQGPYLHDQRDLPGREVLPYPDGGDERQGDQQVGLDVVLEDDAPGRAEKDREAAEDDRDPCDIRRQNAAEGSRQAQRQRNRREQGAYDRDAHLVLRPPFK